MVARLAEPVEVLELVDDEQPVRPGHDPAFDPYPQDQPGEDRDGEDREPRERRQLEPVEPADGGSGQERRSDGSTTRPRAARGRTASRRTRRRAAIRSRTAGISTRGIDSRDPSRSAHTIPVSHSR